MLTNTEHFARMNPKLLRVQAGEAAKFIVVINGEDNIDKQSILTSLKKIGGRKAHKIYYEYVQKIDKTRSDEYSL